MAKDLIKDVKCGTIEYDVDPCCHGMDVTIAEVELCLIGEYEDLFSC